MFGNTFSSDAHAFINKHSVFLQHKMGKYKLAYKVDENYINCFCEFEPPKEQMMKYLMERKAFLESIESIKKF